jgi:hypothetical protein
MSGSWVCQPILTIASWRLIEVDSACGDAHASGLLAMVLKSGKPVAVRNPREVATQDVNRERSGLRWPIASIHLQQAPAVRDKGFCSSFKLLHIHLSVLHSIGHLGVIASQVPISLARSPLPGEFI